jgi:integrase/recombinase XerD
MSADLANEALIDSWRLSLHGKAARTGVLYLAELERFTAWLVGHGRPRATPGDLAAVGRSDVEAYLTDLQAQGRAPATIRSRWIALRNFYGWAADEDEVADNPMARVKVAKATPPPVEVLNDSDLAGLFKACAGTGFYDRRDLALLRLLAATGLRASEVIDLAAEDVDLANRVLIVRHGKGDKSRSARFDPGTAQAVDRYRRARARHRLAPLSAFWIGHRGPLTRKGLGPILNKRAALAGLDHVHPHQLRHTWADRWLAAGGGEGDLQRLGGWESAEVMRRYGAVRATDRALIAYDTVNPLGSL